MPSLVAVHPEIEPLLDARTGAQRARILEGMTQAVADRGYAQTTVADAVAAARVSRGTFYALFDSKEACFLEAYRHGIDVLVGRIRIAVRETGGDWEANLRAALRAYLGTLAAEPLFARTHLLEIHAAGPLAQTRHAAALRRFADRYRASFEAALGEHPELTMPSGDAIFVLAAGVDQLVCAKVREGDLASLPQLEDSLFCCAAAVLFGTAANPDQKGLSDGSDVL